MSNYVREKPTNLFKGREKKKKKLVVADEGDFQLLFLHKNEKLFTTSFSHKDIFLYIRKM